MNIRTKVNVELFGFDVPNSVTEKLPPPPIQPPCVSPVQANPARMWKLSELSSETLSQLCDEFKREVFERAGKRMPPTDDRS